MKTKAFKDFDERTNNHEMLSFLVKRYRMISFAIRSFWDASILKHPQKRICFGRVAGNTNSAPKQFLEPFNLLSNIFFCDDTRNSTKPICSGSNYRRSIGMIYSANGNERDIDLAADLLD